MTLKLLPAVALVFTVPVLALAADLASAEKDDLKMKTQQMMTSMEGVQLTGDADRDFADMMVPHHQGAMSMAKIELQYGKDPKLKALAASILQSQQKELGQLQGWQAAHPK